MKLFKHRFLLGLFLLSVFLSRPFPVFASGADDSKNCFDFTQCFRLDPLTDGILIGSGVLLNGTNLVLGKMKEPSGGYSYANDFNQPDVNWIDRWCMNRYSKPLDKVSTAFTFAALFTPSFLLTAPHSEYLLTGVMYAESVALTWGLKELGKNLIKRNRPYMYFENYPRDEISSGDFQCSFPSGHTALAFTGATFCTYVFSEYFDDSSWKIPVMAASYSLAAFSAVSRIASGNHFLTDVLAGAVIGTFSGFFVPWLHTLDFKRKEEAQTGIKSFSIGVFPSGIQLRLGF